MANSRMAKFVTEAAPPQFVSVMRHRTSKMLDTINEDDREIGEKYSRSLLPKSLSSLSSSTSAPSSKKVNSKFFLKEFQRTFSVFGN